MIQPSTLSREPSPVPPEPKTDPIPPELPQPGGPAPEDLPPPPPHPTGPPAPVARGVVDGVVIESPLP